LVHAFLAAYLGNLAYALTARNFNPVIAVAGATVIVQADNIVPVGIIAPDHVMTPAPVVDYLITNSCDQTGRPDHHRPTHCQRAVTGDARQSRNRHPDTVANFVPKDMHVFFQSENGLIGTGPIPEEGMAHPTLTDAGGRPVTALPGASTFDSAISFGLIRGGHLDLRARRRPSGGGKILDRKPPARVAARIFWNALA
jgi:3-oxoacid CoA-transferase